MLIYCEFDVFKDVCLSPIMPNICLDDRFFVFCFYWSSVGRFLMLYFPAFDRWVSVVWCFRLFLFFEKFAFWLVKNCGSFSFCETLYLMDQNFGVLSIFGSLGSYIIAALISKRNFITKISNKFKSGCLLNSLEAAHVLLVMFALDCLL